MNFNTSFFKALVAKNSPISVLDSLVSTNSVVAKILYPYHTVGSNTPPKMDPADILSYLSSLDKKNLSDSLLQAQYFIQMIVLDTHLNSCPALLEDPSFYSFFERVFSIENDTYSHSPDHSSALLYTLGSLEFPDSMAPHTQRKLVKFYNECCIKSSLPTAGSLKNCINNFVSSQPNQVSHHLDIKAFISTISAKQNIYIYSGAPQLPHVYREEEDYTEMNIVEFIDKFSFAPYIMNELSSSKIKVVYSTLLEHLCHCLPQEQINDMIDSCSPGQDFSVYAKNYMEIKKEKAFLSDSILSVPQTLVSSTNNPAKHKI